MVGSESGTSLPMTILRTRRVPSTRCLDSALEAVGKHCATKAPVTHHRWWKPASHSHFLFCFLMNEFNIKWVPCPNPLILLRGLLTA